MRDTWGAVLQMCCESSLMFALFTLAAQIRGRGRRRNTSCVPMNRLIRCRRHCNRGEGQDCIPAVWLSNRRRVTFSFLVNSFSGIFHETSFRFTSSSRFSFPCWTKRSAANAVTDLLLEAAWNSSLAAALVPALAGLGGACLGAGNSTSIGPWPARSCLGVRSRQ
jgi:hypothetical protein